VTLRLHGDTLAEPGSLDFAVNVWPGRPAALRRVLADALDDERYPDEAAATEALAAAHGRAPDEVLPTNGACDAFWLLAHALRPRTGACVHPSFTEPEAALRAVGARIVRVHRDPDAWLLDPGSVPDDAEVVVVGNPNNPTGSLDDSETVLALARPGRVLVVDESFMDFVDGDAPTLAGRGDVPGLVVVRSLTKLWSLAGVRAGYLLGPAELVARLKASRQPWSVNGLACAALAWCAAERETPRRIAAEIAAARRELVHGLEALDGIRVWPSAANFLLLHLTGAAEVVRGLRERGIAVRPASSFPGLDDGYIRVAVRRPGENARLLAALDELTR
jgi:histidinol-phosphate/aromatic aminotransferase/cobyric acid decarboxylase-like protein